MYQKWGRGVGLKKTLQKEMKSVEIFGVNQCMTHRGQFIVRKGGLEMRVGYIRVSTEEQKIDRQEVMMKKLGVEKLFIDKLSGKNTHRPELQRLVIW